MKKLFLSTFLLVLPLLASAYNIYVVNADGVTIYYNYISDGTELEVVKAGNGYSGEGFRCRYGTDGSEYFQADRSRDAVSRPDQGQCHPRIPRI